MSESIALIALRKLLRMRHACPGARYEARRAIGAIRLIRCVIS